MNFPSGAVMKSPALLVGLLLATPLVSHAQSTTQSFAYLRGADTLGVETITLTPTRITGDLVLAGAPRVMWTHERQGTSFGAGLAGQRLPA